MRLGQQRCDQPASRMLCTHQSSRFSDELLSGLASPKSSPTGGANDFLRPSRKRVDYSFWILRRGDQDDALEYSKGRVGADRGLTGAVRIGMPHPCEGTTANRDRMERSSARTIARANGARRSETSKAALFKEGDEPHKTCGDANYVTNIGEWKGWRAHGECRRDPASGRWWKEQADCARKACRR